MKVTRFSLHPFVGCAIHDWIENSAVHQNSNHSSLPEPENPQSGCDELKGLTYCMIKIWKLKTDETSGPHSLLS